MGRIHVPAMEPLLRTSPRALVSRVYSVCTLFRDSTLVHLLKCITRHDLGLVSSLTTRGL